MNVSAPPATSSRDLLLLTAGLVLWSAFFVLIYGVQALGCQFGWQHVALGPVSLHRVVLVLIWMSGIGAGAWLARWLWRRAQRQRLLLREFSAVLGGAGLIAIVVTGAPSIALSICH